MVLAVILVIILSLSIAYYFIKIQPPQTDGDVDVIAIINYGSLGEIPEEYNISIPAGSTALKVFRQIALLDTINYSIGVYIRGVNGYLEDLPSYWSFQYFDINIQDWINSEIGVDKYFVSDGDKIKLQYTG